MNVDDGKFEWTAFSPGHWDHYHHAGQQVRFYRQQPWDDAGFAPPEPRWVTFLLSMFWRG